MSLTFDQQRRYARQIQLPEFGEAAQTRLRTARVLVVGAGGLGSAAISYLAAAGIGALGIIDDDRVELSNLNRQILHETGDIGRLKAESARDRVEELNPDCTVEIFAQKLDASNAATLIANYDMVADGSDNFVTRFAVNAACVSLAKPLISAAVVGWHGQVSSFAPHLGGPCYQCFVSPEAPDANTCREAGIIGPLCGMVGSMQALEVIHMVLGTPQLLSSLLMIDGKNFLQRRVALPKDAACEICSNI